jgi:hypothetical protein
VNATAPLAAAPEAAEGPLAPFTAPGPFDAAQTPDSAPFTTGGPPPLPTSPPRVRATGSAMALPVAAAAIAGAAAFGALLL